MNSKQQKPVTPWPLIILFLIITAVLTISGIFFYRNQKRELLESSLKELSTIADLKTRQLTEWRRERIADGIFLGSNASMVRQFRNFLENPGNKKVHQEILSDLKSLTENHDFRNALFLDKDLNVHLFYPGTDTLIGDYLKGRLPEIIGKGEVVLTDFHQTGKVSFIHLDLLIPLKDVKDTSAFGILVLRITPEIVLYPLIKDWPVRSKTAETLIFHREGDEIVYLNELRHVQNSEMVLRRLVTDERLAAAMALRGVRESLDAVDYRGVPVIAAMNKVPESPWFLVAKVDKEEVFEVLGRQTRFVISLVVLLVISAGLFLGVLAWTQRARFYRSRYEAELDRMAIIKHFDYILKNANDIILLFDKNFFIIEANDKALETYQYNRNELIGRDVKILRAPEAVESLQKDLEELNTRGFSIYETIHCRKDGKRFPVEISARRIDIEGIMYYQSISRDITDRKLAEDTLKESEEKFRKIFEESPVGMVMTGKDFGIVRANNSFCKMTGYREDELMDLTFRNLTHPDHLGTDEVSLLLLIAKKIPVYHTEKRYLRKDGKLIWGSTTVVLIRNRESEARYFFAMVEDITSKKLAEEQIEKSLSLQIATLESTADGILVVDNNGKIVQFNRKFAEMWMIPDTILEEMKDESALSFVLDQLIDPEDFLDRVRMLYSDPEAITSDLIEFKDGRCFDRFSQPQRIAGKTVGRVWCFRDITERKKAEAELISAKEKAEEGDRLKTAFLHNISHEIRTPMNAILGFSTLLKEPGTSEEERKQFIDVIFQSGNQLLSIINDIVDLASIESGQVKIARKQININTTLRRLSEQFSYKEKLQKISLGISTPLPQSRAEIITDNTKLLQILSNLISNSFKFTSKGKINFGYSLNEDFLEFFVSDTGIGIPPEHQTRIFDRFYQVDSTVSRQYGGTGLGLSICKAYVELLGGKIWLESKPEKGTKFFFTIPYVPVTELSQ